MYALKAILKCVKKGIFCEYSRCKKNKKSKSEVPTDTSGDDTTDYEDVHLKEPLLIFLSLDRVLLYVSKTRPSFIYPFDKPQSACTNLTFKIEVDQAGSDEK